MNTAKIESTRGSGLNRWSPGDVPRGAPARGPVPRGGRSVALRVLAGVTIAWALACTALTLRWTATPDSGPPGHGGIGGLMGGALLVVLWVCVIAAAALPLVGGVLLGALGVLLMSMEVSLPVRWGVGMPALLLGVAMSIAALRRSGGTTRHQTRAA